MDSMKGLMPNMPGQKKDPWDELNDQCSLTKKQVRRTGRLTSQDLGAPRCAADAALPSVS